LYLILFEGVAKLLSLALTPRQVKLNQVSRNHHSPKVYQLHVRTSKALRENKIDGLSHRKSLSTPTVLNQGPKLALFGVEVLIFHQILAQHPILKQQK
jgi:hypothetical protein